MYKSLHKLVRKISYFRNRKLLFSKSYGDYQFINKQTDIDRQKQGKIIAGMNHSVKRISETSSKVNSESGTFHMMSALWNWAGFAHALTISFVVSNASTLFNRNIDYTSKRTRD